MVDVFFSVGAPILDSYSKTMCKKCYKECAKWLKRAKL
jgi:hypothetical protein